MPDRVNSFILKALFPTENSTGRPPAATLYFKWHHATPCRVAERIRTLKLNSEVLFFFFLGGKKTSWPRKRRGLQSGFRAERGVGFLREAEQKFQQSSRLPFPFRSSPGLLVAGSVGCRFHLFVKPRSNPSIQLYIIHFVVTRSPGRASPTCLFFEQLPHRVLSIQR